MTRPQLIIAAGKEKALMRRHPWIFSGAVKRMVGCPQEGDLVDVCTANGQWVATGHYQNDSIVCKVLSFDTPDIDRDFFRQRLQSAIAYRERLGFFGSKKEELRIENYPGAAANSQFSILNSQTTNVFRLVHAEGDFLPGLVCDWYNGVLVMQAHSVGMHRLFPLFTELFVELLGSHGIKAVFDNGKRMRLTMRDTTRERLEAREKFFPGKIEYLDIKDNSPILKEMRIVDTPGLSDLDDLDKQVTDYLVNADAVMYATSALLPFSESEQVFLGSHIQPQRFSMLYILPNHPSNASR